jgi:hypothetical protein
MARILTMTPEIEGDRFQRLVKQYNETLERERRVGKRIGRIERRFLENDLPETRRRRAVLWNRLNSLLRDKKRLSEQQLETFHIAHRISAHTGEEDGV